MKYLCFLHTLAQFRGILSGSCLTLFDIHERTGEVTIASEIDRDSGVILVYGGVCELTVLVRL